MKYPGHTRRRTNFWDPIYENKSTPIERGTWAEIGNKSSSDRVFQFNNAHKELTEFKTSILIFEGHKFFKCDFRGYLEPYSQVVFKNCYFYKCDFGLSWLNNIKLSGCKFRMSSFTQCNMNGAEFRKTIWHDIGISGNETVVNDCYITNPMDFLSAMFVTAVSSEKEKSKFAKFQKLATQATVSRGLIIASKKHGSESEFYRAVEAYELYQGRSRVAEAEFMEAKGLKLFRIFQHKFLKAFGTLNSWGKNPLKPLTLLFASFLLFCTVYTFMLESHSVLNGVEKSFNITVIAGYSVEASDAKQHDFFRVIQAFQFLVSLILYTVFFATLVGRLSRVKQ